MILAPLGALSKKPPLQMKLSGGSMSQDSNEQIYQSGLIEPDKALEQVDLDRNMESGVYALDMRIDTYTLDSQSALNNAIVSTKLIVQ